MARRKNINTLTTAIYPNRIIDRNKVESELHYSEFGDTITNFYISKHLFAIGYKRIVYGDHGAYIEFEYSNIKCKLLNKQGIEVTILPEEFSHYYYIWLYPEFDYSTKVYWQIKPVTNLPNAPMREDGLPNAFNRREGYADYRRNMYYVNPYVFDN